MAESLTRHLKEAQVKKELEEHDFRNQINSLLRKIEQLENTITEERATKKVYKSKTSSWMSRLNSGNLFFFLVGNFVF